jgi:hypothetical protein
MPNTVVKLFSANGSWGISPCESRTLPGKRKKAAHDRVAFFVVENKRTHNRALFDRSRNDFLVICNERGGRARRSREVIFLDLLI